MRSRLKPTARAAACSKTSSEKQCFAVKMSWVTTRVDRSTRCGWASLKWRQRVRRDHCATLLQLSSWSFAKERQGPTFYLKTVALQKDFVGKSSNIFIVSQLLPAAPHISHTRSGEARAICAHTERYVNSRDERHYRRSAPDAYSYRHRFPSFTMTHDSKDAGAWWFGGEVSIVEPKSCRNWTSRSAKWRSRGW